MTGLRSCGPYIQWNITQPSKRTISSTFAATWMGLEEIMLREISQAEKNNYHMVPLIYGT